MRAPALASLAIGLTCFLAAPFLLSLPGVAIPLFIAGTGCCVYCLMFFGFIRLKRELDPYDLRKLRELHDKTEARSLEVPDVHEAVGVLCPHCMELYDARLPVCPRCGRM